MLEWKDTSNYTRGKKGKVAPNNLTLQVNDIFIMIHKHICYGEEWLLTSTNLNIDKYDLKTTDVEDAKMKALKLIKNTLNKRIEEYKKAIEQI